MTGIPPPPAAMTSVSFSTRVLILSSSIIDIGCGDGTRPMGLLGLLKAGSPSSTSTWVTSVTTCLSMPIE